MSPFLIIIITLVVFLLIVVGILSYSFAKDKKKKQHKINVIRGSAAPEKKDNADTLRNKRRAEIASKLKEENNKASDSKKNSVANLLIQAGLDDITQKQYWIGAVILSVVCIGLAVVFNASPVVIIMLGITGLLGVPRLILKRMIAKRQKKFLEEFADALEAMVRLLKAGMPVSEAVLMASKEFEGPVAEEMSKIYDSQKIGVPLAEATYEASYRMPLTEMQMFATAISIQAQTGASLSEVLINLAGVIRARFRLKRKVKALSSEAKASAAIIGCLPILVGTGLYFINTELMMLLFTTGTGRSMLVGGVIWMSIGIFIMRAMINFRV
jgi:tight adherence protein B